MRLSLALLGVLASAPALAKPCPDAKFAPKLLTPADATIVAGGGIVVGTVPAPIAKPTGDDAGWRVRAGSQLIAPGIKVIAPGLEVFDVGDAGGTLVLEDAESQELVAVRRGKLAPLAPPRLKRVWSNARSTTPRPYTIVNAELVDKPPAAAIALVVFGKDGTARSWASVVDSTTMYRLYSANGCYSQPPPGSIPTVNGEQIRVAWLDSGGRLSKLSAPIAVGYR